MVKAKWAAKEADPGNVAEIYKNMAYDYSDRTYPIKQKMVNLKKNYE